MPLTNTAILVRSLLLAAFLTIAVATAVPVQTTGPNAAGSCDIAHLPVTEGAVETIRAFYGQLDRVCADMNRATWARRLMDHYFAEDFVGHGGADNHDYGFATFKHNVGVQFERNPGVRLHVEHIVGGGNTGVVHVALRNPGEVNLYEYLSLYTVRDGRFRERWAFGDRNFP